MEITRPCVVHYILDSYKNRPLAVAGDERLKVMLTYYPDLIAARRLLKESYQNKLMGTFSSGEDNLGLYLINGGNVTFHNFNGKFKSLNLTLAHEDPKKFPKFARTLGLESPHFELWLIRARDNPERAYAEAERRLFQTRD